MGLSVDFNRLKRIQRLTTPQQMAAPILRGIKQQVGLLLKSEFATGTGPSGDKWKPTVRGRQPLQSRKLASAFDITADADSVRGVGKSKRDMLTAHQEGRVFKSRRVVENKQYLTFDKRGRLIRNSRALNRKGDVKRGVRQTFARAHTVGQRVLPARPIIPDRDGELPANWVAAVNAGAVQGMQWWSERAAR